MVRAPEKQVEDYRLRTTVGRVLFNDALPDGLPYVNGLLAKKGLQSLVYYVYLRHGIHMTVQLVDKLKELGFLFATRAGVSIGIDDMVVPAGEGEGRGQRAQRADHRRASSSSRA